MGCDRRTWLSIDLLAFHLLTRTLVVVEIKTGLFDIQDLLARPDRKVRLAVTIAREAGWRPVVVVPMLVLPGDTTTRRRLRQHAPLFTRFALRGRAAVSWLADPCGEHAPEVCS